MKTVLLLEDERSIADTVIHCVEREGFTVEWLDQGLPGLVRLRQGGIDLLVLDVGLPDISGFELCKEIRTFSDIPIIFLTARDDEIDRVVGFEIGADDYVPKPFSPRELAVRIKAVLRRSGGTRQKMQEESALVVDEEKMQAHWRGRKLDLTRYEFRLLALLARFPGRVFSRDELMRQVWGEDSPSLDRTVDAHVKSLRNKFKGVSGDIDPVNTVRGMGYALREDL